MWGKLVTKLVIFCLKRAKITYEDRAKLTAELLDKLGAFPLHDIININPQGTVFIKEQPLDIEMARVLRESARNALKSQALILIREQVVREATLLGVHKLETVEQMMFMRAAIWWGQQEDKYLKLLAQVDEEGDLNPTD